MNKIIRALPMIVGSIGLVLAVGTPMSMALISPGHDPIVHNDTCSAPCWLMAVGILMFMGGLFFPLIHAALTHNLDRWAAED